MCAIVFTIRKRTAKEVLNVFFLPNRNWFPAQGLDTFVHLQETDLATNMDDELR